MRVRSVVVSIMCIISMIVGGCTASMVDNIVTPLEIGSSYLSLIRMGAMIAADDTRYNAEGLEELSERYGIPIAEAYHELYIASKYFVAVLDKLQAAMKAEHDELLRSREMCNETETN